MQDSIKSESKLVRGGKERHQTRKEAALHVYAGNLDPTASAKVNLGRVYLLFKSSSNFQYIHLLQGEQEGGDVRATDEPQMTT
jgi:hypothetical protein